MTNAELIKALRICANQTCCDNCPRYDIDHTQDAQRCCIELINDAADALEAADKRIEELEDARKDGKELWNEAWKALQEKDKRIAELEAQLPKQDRGVCMTAIGTLYVPNYDDER